MAQKKTPSGKRKYPAFVISVSVRTGCYRHLLVSKYDTLEELALDILEAFDFDNDHLSAFFMDGVWGKDAYYVNAPCYDDEEEEEEEQRYAMDYTLEQVLTEGQKFHYLFDFGDEWLFRCKVLRSGELEGKNTQLIRRVGQSPEQYPEWENED